MRSSNGTDWKYSDRIANDDLLDEATINSIPRMSGQESADFNRKLLNFLRVAEENRAKLLRMAERVTHCREDAEDVLQYALLRAWLNLSQFREEAKMSTWLGTIVQNSAREYLRRRRGFTFISVDPYSPDDRAVVRDITDPARNPEEYRQWRETEEILYSEIDKLVPYCRSVVQMCVLREIPQREVAQSLNVSVATIKSRMFRSKQLLRRAVRERYGVGDLSATAESFVE